MMNSATHPPKLEDAIETLYRLHVGIIGNGPERHERPHKPLLLLAVLDLVAERVAEPHKIKWGMRLRSLFTQYFELVKQRDDDSSPENPFLYLRKEGWWEPMKIVPGGRTVPLESTPTVAEANAGTVYARISTPIEPFLHLQKDRMELRLALVSRYFPGKMEALRRLFIEPSLHDMSSAYRASTQPEGREMESELASDAESEVGKSGRSAGFRRKVVEAYDFQCAACGLRIKLPGQKELREMTFVDAAHLIPFSTSFNDHPTNGMALCKNHHWAMDRFLIAPGPSGVWEVSRKLMRHRSAGEAELVELQGRRIIPPLDDAYLPSREALEWRVGRLWEG